jgi:hypothetical protein
MFKKIKEMNDQFIANAQIPKNQTEIDEQKAYHAKLLEKFGLNLDSYTDEQIRAKNTENIKNIATDLGGNTLAKVGMGLSMAKIEEQVKISYLSALVEQNWILMRQNEAILRVLEKLSNK